MKITDALLGEHALLYAQFDYLQQATPAAETLAVVHSLAAGLTATLASHAHLEDELLFSTLDPYLGPMGPLAVMRMEHDQIEGLLGQVPAAQELDQAQRLLQQAVQVARSHFAKEEQVLFPMALQVLEQSKLAALAAQWAERRGVHLLR
ncbi:MAG: hemerythrin domain-containing protein [Caldilineales bacterium]|nr:hemerythrin domain-containing protein [Caldilineales bacterium]MCW5857464.1 hemerythrin domain-containing protein [Caldilineales bacterium]